MYPYSNPSILAKGINFIKAIKWNSLLDGTGKTLGVINQAIPIIYQVKPLFGNVKTLFKIANGINSNEGEIKIDNVNFTSQSSDDNKPIFYI